MTKTKSLIKHLYIWIILALFYIPLFFSTVFSFNEEPKKGGVVFNRWNGFSWKGWSDLFTRNDLANALVNSLIIGISASLIVAFLTLLTCFSLWNQKNKSAKYYVLSTESIPLINPDIITATSLVVTFASLFGFLSTTTGMFHAIISHVVVILPFGITIMYPRSQKFDAALWDASLDLGYGSFKTWWKTYFVHMRILFIAIIFISLTLSIDDFILVRIISSTNTIGTVLYSSSLHGWALSLGSIFLFIVIIIAISLTIINWRKDVQKNK